MELENKPSNPPTTMPITASLTIQSVLCKDLFIGPNSFKNGDILTVNEVNAIRGKYRVSWSVTSSPAGPRQFWLENDTELKKFEDELDKRWRAIKYSRDEATDGQLYLAVFNLIQRI